MTMRPAFLMVVMVIAGIPLLAQSEIDKLQATLNSPIIEYDLSANGLADALAKTSKHFHFPLGIEWVRDKDTLRSFNHTWNGETVRQILHSIVEAYPGYDFRVEDGVVHAFRLDLLDETHNFMNLKIPDYFEVGREPAGFANAQLRNVIQNIVSPRDVPPGAGDAGSYTSGNVTEEPITVSLHGLTVRVALEKLVLVSEHNLWIVTFSDTQDLTPTGFRRTETLWHAAPFPNTQQPMWDFLTWEEYSLVSERSSSRDK
jgi:hypothetical protein